MSTKPNTATNPVNTAKENPAKERAAQPQPKPKLEPKPRAAKVNAEKPNLKKDNANKESVKVHIMQREFTVACGKDESAGVREAAAYLDQQMRAVSNGTQVLGTDRCAILAGLNISHELLALRKAAEAGERIHSRLENLHRQIDDVVTHIGQSVS